VEVDMARIVLGQVNVVSRDPAASLAFYRRLGVEMPDNRVWHTPSGIHHASAVERETAVTLDIDSAPFAPHWNAGWKGIDNLAGRVVIGFKVPAASDVDAIVEDMTESGYRCLQPAWNAFWGARYAVLEDPDGIAVGIMGPISADKKYPPPTI
jgi:catechol 2,3-dioxygenase-like lactoylglutathione lyase family enzyme